MDRGIENRKHGLKVITNEGSGDSKRMGTQASSSLPPITWTTAPEAPSADALRTAVDLAIAEFSSRRYDEQEKEPS